MLSIRVNLGFINQYDIQLLKRIPDFNGLLRLVALVIFKSPIGWTDPQEAIVDTGAHTSILPKWLWTLVEKQVIGNYYIRGIVPDPKCQMNVDVAWVTSVLLDEAGNKTDEIRFRAYLAPTDEIPIVIGFKDLLERFDVCFNFPRRKAYIQST